MYSVLVFAMSDDMIVNGRVCYIWLSIVVNCVYYDNNIYSSRFRLIIMSSPYVGTRVPIAILNQITKDVESGEFSSPAEWVREACRRFYEVRKGDRLGGGGL